MKPTLSVPDHRERHLAFKGFVPDLVCHLLAKLGIEYHIQVPPDGKFGTQDEDGEWSGIIGEVQHGVCICTSHTLTSLLLPYIIQDIIKILFII